MKKLLFPLALCFVYQLTFSQATINIDIQGSHPYKKAYLKIGYGSFPQLADSAMFKNGKASFVLADSIRERHPNFASISLIDDKGSNIQLFVENYMRPGKREAGIYPADTIINITGLYDASKRIQLYQISKYSEGDVYFANLNAKLFSTTDTSRSKMDSLKNYIVAYPRSQILLQKVWQNRRAYSYDLLHGILVSFSPEMLDTELGSKLLIFEQNKKSEEDNAEYTNLLLLDKDGKEFPIFDELKEANLIVFWASWCVPCRAEIPTLVKLYDQVKSSHPDFQITHISVDEKKDAWLKADAKVALPWRSLWTPKVETVSGAYNYSLPSNFLITKDKRIHRIDIRDIEGVQEIFKALGMENEKFEYPTISVSH